MTNGFLECVEVGYSGSRLPRVGYSGSRLPLNFFAAFFAPLIGIVPSSGTPPLMQILSIARLQARPAVAAAPGPSIGGLTLQIVLVLESEAALKPRDRRHPSAVRRS